MSSDKAPEISTMFVELDAILDTRLATLYGMGEDVVYRAFRNNYSKRVTDDFYWLTDEEKVNFNLLYKNRNRLTLRDAVLTPIVTLMREFVIATITQSMETPFIMTPKIVVNIHPYKLLPEEIDVQLAVYRSLTKGKCTIEIVDMPIEQITPAYVKRNLSAIILYSPAEWLETHARLNNFDKVNCPEVGMMGPGLYPTMQQVPHGNVKDGELNYLEAFEITANPLISLRLLSAEHFSAATGVSDRDLVKTK